MPTQDSKPSETSEITIIGNLRMLLRRHGVSEKDIENVINDNKMDIVKSLYTIITSPAFGAKSTEQIGSVVIARIIQWLWVKMEVDKNIDITWNGLFELFSGMFGVSSAEKFAREALDWESATMIGRLFSKEAAKNIADQARHYLDQKGHPAQVPESCQRVVPIITVNPRFGTMGSKQEKWPCVPSSPNPASVPSRPGKDVRGDSGQPGPDGDQPVGVANADTQGGVSPEDQGAVFSTELSDSPVDIGAAHDSSTARVASTDMTDWFLPSVVSSAVDLQPVASSTNDRSWAAPIPPAASQGAVAPAVAGTTSRPTEGKALTPAQDKGGGRTGDRPDPMVSADSMAMVGDAGIAPQGPMTLGSLPDRVGQTEDDRHGRGLAPVPSSVALSSPNQRPPIASEFWHPGPSLVDPFVQRSLPMTLESAMRLMPAWPEPASPEPFVQRSLPMTLESAMRLMPAWPEPASPEPAAFGPPSRPKVSEAAVEGSGPPPASPAKPPYEGLPVLWESPGLTVFDMSSVPMPKLGTQPEAYPGGSGAEPSAGGRWSDTTAETMTPDAMRRIAREVVLEALDAQARKPRAFSREELRIITRAVFDRMDELADRPATGRAGFDGRMSKQFVSTYNPRGLRW